MVIPAHLVERVAALASNGAVRIRVKPGARVSAIRDVVGDIVHLDIAAPPEDGKANAEVERYLKKAFGRTAKIISGRTSKEKLVKLI